MENDIKLSERVISIGSILHQSLDQIYFDLLGEKLVNYSENLWETLFQKSELSNHLDEIFPLLTSTPRNQNEPLIQTFNSIFLCTKSLSLFLRSLHDPSLKENLALSNISGELKSLLDQISQSNNQTQAARTKYLEFLKIFDSNQDLTSEDDLQISERAISIASLLHQTLGQFILIFLARS